MTVAKHKIKKQGVSVKLDLEPAPDIVTANSGGAAWTPDEGTTWYVLPGVSGCWAVAFANPGAGWLVGTNGQIIKISF